MTRIVTVPEDVRIEPVLSELPFQGFHLSSGLMKYRVADAEILGNSGAESILENNPLSLKGIRNFWLPTRLLKN